MSVDLISHRAPAGPATMPAPERGPLRLVRRTHPALEAQQAFAADAEELLRRAGVTGERLATALFLVLRQHAAVSALDPDTGLHLTCAECRSGDRAPAEQYPCPTAQQAYWALDAVLR